MGDDFADLILTNCSLVNVYSKEIQEKIQIAITNDRIAFVGPDASHTIGPKTKILDVKNKFVSSCLIVVQIPIAFQYFETISPIGISSPVNEAISKGILNGFPSDLNLQPLESIFFKPILSKIDFAFSGL